MPTAVAGDYMMARNRLVFGAFMLSLSFMVGDVLFDARWRAPIAAWIALGAVMLAFLAYAPRHHATRRHLCVLLDVGGTTIMMIAGGPSTSFLYVMYHWIIVGNTYRFGGRYAGSSAVASIAGFGLAIACDPFWRGNPSLSAGLVGGLLALPAYSYFLTRQLENARRDAEQANEAKSLFLAAVSHELRTPLNIIMGTVDLLASTPLDADQGQMIGTIHTAADAQLAIVTDLLAFASSEAGPISLHPVDFDPAQLLARLDALMQPLAINKGLLFIAGVASALPRLTGDERRIQEVLVNLCSNAIKFTQAGSVTVTLTGEVGGAGQAELRFEVTDTGIGIAAEALDQIFEPFIQADRTILDRFGGTGLGLALCKRQIELMQGQLGVTSKPGHGSTFWFTLVLPRAGDQPAVADQQGAAGGPARGTADAALPALRGCTVLIADDNVINRRIIGKMLELEGVGTLFACNGEEALDMLIDHRVDAALLDINMPVMNGIDTARMYAFSAVPGRPVPLIALTADATAATGADCLAAGMREVLTKPIRRAQLLECLGRHVTAEPDATAAPPAPIADVFDAEPLDSLRLLAGEEFTDMLLSEFARDGRAILADLDAACLTCDVGSFRTAAHAFASMSANMGAVRISTLCLQWQFIPEPEFRDERDVLSRRLRVVWDQTCAAQLAWQDRRYREARTVS